MALVLRRGTPSDQDMWSGMFWLSDSDTQGRMITQAVRQKRSDEQWYITDGLCHHVKELHGPFGSVEAAAMLWYTGAL